MQFLSQKTQQSLYNTGWNFLSVQQGAQLECKDVRGWTALLHSTATGHQQMVKFLLENHANANVKWVTFAFINTNLQANIMSFSIILELSFFQNSRQYCFCSLYNLHNMHIFCMHGTFSNPTMQCSLDIDLPVPIWWINWFIGDVISIYLDLFFDLKPAERFRHFYTKLD